MNTVHSRLPQLARTPDADVARESRADSAWLVREVLAAQRVAIPGGLLALFLAGMLLGMGFYVLQVTGNPLTVLVRDANVIAGQPNYFGALEYAEVLLMSGAGWIAAFSSLFCRRQAARFLFLGGLLSLLLAADDLYMLHESSWRFNISEQYVFLLYAVLLVLLVVTNLRYFLNTPFVLLGTALVLFAMAVLLDAGMHPPFGLTGGIEDVLEVVGVCFWSVYFAWCSWDTLRNQRPSQAPR